MAHHKRKRPKHQRAGCLYCKPHKDERVKGSKQAKTRQELLADQEDLSREPDAHRRLLSDE